MQNGGEPHPYKKHGVNEILAYAPRNKAELNVLKRIIIASYEYVTNEVYELVE